LGFNILGIVRGAACDVCYLVCDVCGMVRGLCCGWVVVYRMLLVM